MYPEFKDKVVLITGGSSGIGAACALRFADEGAKVIIAARDSTKGEVILQKIQKRGGNAAFITSDLTKKNDIKKLFSVIECQYHGLDYAVNNAGMEGIPFTKIIDYPEESWDQVIYLNLKAVWLCLKYELPLMLKRGAGVIINVSSIAGLQASLTGGAAYTASKHGVIGLTKSAALEYAEKGIRVNAVCPAIINTELTREILIEKKLKKAAQLHPMKRLGEPEEVASSIVWLCSNQASFITAAALPVDGGILG